MKKPGEEMVAARSVLALHAAARSIGVDISFGDFFPGLDPEDRDGLVASSQQARFVQNILAVPRETIGLELGINLPFDGLGFWGFLLRSSPAFGDMLYRAERYIRIVNKYPEFFLESRGDLVAQVCAHPQPSPFGPRDQVVQTFLSHWLAWGRLLTQTKLTPVAANFTWSGPVDTRPFEDFYNCPISFGAEENMLVFNKQTLQTRFPDSTRHLSEDFENYATTLIQQMTLGDDFMNGVCRAIEDGLANGQGREADVADRLAMTTRTLHRKLRSRNTSFRQLRDEVLIKKAKSLLAQGNIPIAEISFVLGYSEVSTFYRAFKRWTGTVPKAWRERHLV